jgi:hypothetical protein
LAISRHLGAPISQSNESVWTSSRPGTSSGSRSLAKETRFGAPGTEFEELVVDLLWLETAKMHPSGTSCGLRGSGVRRASRR